jgi:hypothetical protein
MGCNPAKEGGIPCCAGLQCFTEKNPAGQCLAPDPNAPSDNPYAPAQINEQGWHIGCNSDVSKKDGMTKFFYVKGDKLVDGAKVDIKQFIKGAEGASDLALGICSKECSADKDCPDVKGTTNKCLEVASGLKICASTDKCLSGMIQADQMCVAVNPFHFGKNQLNFKTYFPVPNHTHGGYNSQQWDMAKDLKSYLPLHLSNWISGVTLGQMLKNTWNWPLDNGKIKKEYVYGTLIGQLFQESAPDTNPKYVESGSINSDPTLLNVGQGGPYQLNDYSKQLPPGIEGANGMLNYNALYHDLGYTVAEQNSDGAGSQTKKRGPKMLNSVDHGPMVANYFHFNDVNRYNLIMEAPSNKDLPVAATWRACKKNIESGAFEHPDIMLNVVYNAGPYNSFAKMVFELCAEPVKYAEEIKALLDYSLDDEQFVAAFDKMKNKPRVGTTYIIYPRQINYYVDQFNNDNESLYNRNGAFADVDIPFTMNDVVEQFNKTFTSLGYKNKESIYTLVDAAFLKANQPEADLTKAMTFSKKDDRETFFAFVEQWIANMEKAENFKFSDATQCDQKVGEKLVTECAPPAPQCDEKMPPNLKTLCQCIEDKVTKTMKMHCQSEQIEKTCVDQWHCTCQKSTGTTTAAPIPQEGDACTAQNCATGLACLAQVYADGKQVFSEFRYDNEKQTCMPYAKDPMISALIAAQDGSVADGKSCKASSDCAADSVCVKGNVWIGNAPSGTDAECRANESCKCKKAADSTDPLVKKYLAHKSRSLAIFV